MSLNGAIYEELVGDAGVTAIVGTRVYLDAAVQDPTLPFITYSEIAAEQTEHISGSSDFVRHVYQVECWEDDPHERDTLAAAIRTALHRFGGTMGTGAATATVRDVFIDGDQAVYEPPVDDSEFGDFGQMITFGLWVRG